MGNNTRNATASWSWYFHQWKVGIFVALQRLKELEESDLWNWRIIYENAEDFDIQKKILSWSYKQDWKKWLVDSRHQVKAYKNKTKKYDYRDSLNNFDISSCEQNKCFLHTIEPISDWDTSKSWIQNDKMCITLFEYNFSNGIKKFCPIHDGTLEKETAKIISEIKWCDINSADDIYNYILHQLDKKIHKEHLKDPIGHPKLSFKEIISFIENFETFSEKEESRLRKSFIKFYVDYKMEIMGEGEVEVELDTKESEIDELIKEIYLKDKNSFFQFLRDIHPDRDDIINFSEDANLNRDWFIEVFFRWLYKINSPYNYEKLWFFKEYQHILTTIIANEWRKMQIEGKMMENKKITASLFEWAFIINEYINGKFWDTISDCLPQYKNTNYWRINNETITEPKWMNFISIDNAINKFNS